MFTNTATVLHLDVQLIKHLRSNSLGYFTQDFSINALIHQCCCWKLLTDKPCLKRKESVISPKRLKLCTLFHSSLVRSNTYGFVALLNYAIFLLYHLNLFPLIFLIQNTIVACTNTKLSKAISNNLPIPIYIFKLYSTNCAMQNNAKTVF